MGGLRGKAPGTRPLFLILTCKLSKMANLGEMGHQKSPIPRHHSLQLDDFPVLRLRGPTRGSTALRQII